MLGAVLTAALLVLGVLVFLPREIFPETFSTTIIAAALPFSRKALIVALAGVIACLGGAAIETAMSGAYNVCQFFNLPWGKNQKARNVKQFTYMWLGMFAIALALGLSGLRPLELVDISIVFGMVVMPFTYYPILRVAGDKGIMGKHVNRRSDTIVGAVFLVLISVAAAAAIPLMIVTHSGKP